MTDRDLENKAHNYLIRNSYLIRKKLQDNIDYNLKEVLIDIYKDAFTEGMGDPIVGKKKIEELEERISDLEEESVGTEILKVENL